MASNQPGCAGYLNTAAYSSRCAATAPASPCSWRTGREFPATSCRPCWRSSRAWQPRELYQFPARNGGMHQTPLTPSLSPSDGEWAEGRVRGLPANPLIVIGKWYETPTAGPHLAPHSSLLAGFAAFGGPSPPSLAPRRAKPLVPEPLPFWLAVAAHRDGNSVLFGK